MPALLELDLTEARAAWFFQWFHLLPQTDERAGAGGLIRFLPEGGAFRDKVALDVAVDEQERITALSLGLNRIFIESPEDAAYARDIAQSFLRAAVPAPADEARNLAEEISNASPLGEQASEGYQAYLGEQPEAWLTSPEWSIALRNIMIGHATWLVISLARTVNGA
jgi:hypothetical protein